MPTTSGQGGSGLEPILGIVWRRKTIGVVVFLAAVALTSSVAAFLPNLYRASVTLLVERQQVPEDFVRSTVTTAVDRRLQGISKSLMSGSLLQSLIERHDLYPELRDKLPIGEIVDRMRSYIHLDLQSVDRPGRMERETLALTIAYRGGDAEKATRVVSELASLYVEEDLKARERQSSGTAEFLSQQIEEMKVTLQQQERAVSEFKERHMGELPQQESANLATLERLNGQLLLNSQRQIQVQEQKLLLERSLAEEGAALSGQPEGISLRIARLKQELAELRTRFSDKYPDVVRTRAEIERLEGQLRARWAEGGTLDEAEAVDDARILPLDQALRSADSELRALRREEAGLKQRVAEYQERVENTPRREQQFQALFRDYETTQSVYQSLLRRLGEAKLAESLEDNQKAEQLRMLDPPAVPFRPEAPRRLRLFVVGSMLALALAGGAMVLADRLDTSFHDVDELRTALALPVVTIIERIVTPGDRRARRRQLWLGAVATSFGLAAIVAVTYWIAHDNLWLVAVVSS